jgi:hypothetical protein
MFWKGISVPGPVEVRTAWKYNDLKPRVYFAQGGDTFDASRYIQHVFNILVDSMDCVHRKNRFLPITGELTQRMTTLIYDYESFTSLLDSIHEFLRELSIFFEGVPIQLVGDKDGLVTTTLGELITSYTRTCAEFASFDMCMF